MKAAGLRPTQLDNVILVGGSTRIPLLQRMVAEYFGRRPLADIDPDLVVAQGAALQALSLAEPARKARSRRRVPSSQLPTSPMKFPAKTTLSVLFSTTLNSAVIFAFPAPKSPMTATSSSIRPRVHAKTRSNTR